MDSEIAISTNEDRDNASSLFEPTSLCRVRLVIVHGEEPDFSDSNSILSVTGRNSDYYSIPI